MIRIAAFLFVSVTWGQTPEFEVASIRPSPQGGIIANYTPTLNVAPGATLRFSNLRMRDLIVLAYGVGIRQVAGPNWLITQEESAEVPRFDVIAKIPDDAKREQVALMLQRLLQDRFKMKVHREQRPTQAYMLEVAKGGAKLKESMNGAGQESGCARSFAETPGVTLAAECRGVTAVQLAQQIQSLAPGFFRDGPIVDKTGLSGVYDLKIEWITQVEVNAGSTGPTIFDAVRKFGLTLEKRRENVEFVVVDEAQQMPTEN